MTDPIKAIIGGQVRANSPSEQAAHQAICPGMHPSPLKRKWHSGGWLYTGTTWASGGWVLSSNQGALRLVRNRQFHSSVAFFPELSISKGYCIKKSSHMLI